MDGELLSIFIILLSIKGFLQLLTKEHTSELTSEALGIHDRIFRGVNKLETLINDFIYAAELESGKGKIEEKKHDFITVIKNCIEKMNELITSREHTLSTTLPKTYIACFDKDKIKQVITNLLSNAIK